MKVRILHKFHDKADFTKVYLVGETATFDDARAEYLIGKGLVEAAEGKAVVLEEDAPVAEVLDEEPHTAEDAPVAEAPVVKPVATRRKNVQKEN